MKKMYGVAALLATTLVLTACNSEKEKSNESQQAAPQDESIPKDYKEEIKKLSDASYEDSRAKTDALTTYAQSYTKAYGSAVDNQGKKLNDFLDSVLDKSYTTGSNGDMALNFFESYFLQASSTSEWKDDAPELALAETYHETIRSSIRLSEAMRLNDSEATKNEKQELKKLKQTLARDAKKLGTVKGDKVYYQLEGKKKEQAKKDKKEASLEEKKAQAAKAEKVTVKQQTPVANPNAAQNEPYHYVNGYVYVNTGKSNAGLFLRTGPSQTSSKRLSESLPNATGMTLLGRQGNWYEVYVDSYGAMGWVHSSYVSSQQPVVSQPSQSSLPSTVVVNTGSSTLVLRSGPGKGYSKVTSLENGTYLYVTDSVDGWYEVYDTVSGSTGWVSKQFVR